MAADCASGNPARVALRKESVDRNDWQAAYDKGIRQSLSARRAWIEILAQNYDVSCY